MIDMKDIYRKLIAYCGEEYVIQVRSVVPLKNTFIVTFVRDDGQDGLRWRCFVAIFDERGMANVVDAGDA